MSFFVSNVTIMASTQKLKLYFNLISVRDNGHQINRSAPRNHWIRRKGERQRVRLYFFRVMIVYLISNTYFAALTFFCNFRKTVGFGRLLLKFLAVYWRSFVVVIWPLVLIPILTFETEKVYSFILIAIKPHSLLIQYKECVSRYY